MVGIKLLGLLGPKLDPEGAALVDLRLTGWRTSDGAIQAALALKDHGLDSHKVILSARARRYRRQQAAEY
jgi:hypothetical protein